MMNTLKHNILSDSHLLLMQERDNNYTLDRLATDLKRSKKTIYKVFGSKDSLIKAVFEKHHKTVARQFEEVNRSELRDIDKLLKYIYLIDDSIKEIRLSRWYQQAKRYSKFKELYFELRISVYDAYLRKGLLPYERHLIFYGKTTLGLADFIISSIEFNYFGRSAFDAKASKDYKYADQLIFMLHGCLISLKDA